MNIAAFIRTGLAWLACSSLCAFAQEGYPDLTFGNGGTGVTAFAGAAQVYPKDTAVLPDGRILTLAAVVQNTQTNESYVGIARFKADGTIDNSFSFDGKILADFGGDNTQNTVEAMLAQPDGKILVCGSSVFPGDGGDHSEFAILRFSSDGTLDPGFGTGGKAHIAFDDHVNTNVAFCKAMALQSDDKIVLAGYALVAVGTNNDFAAARLNADGSLDTGFGVGGKRYVPFDFVGSMLDDEARSVAIDADGSILISGIADRGNSTLHNYDMAVVKLTPTGALDPNFNTDGKATVAFDRGGSNDDEALQVLIQKNGKILLIGSAIGNATAGNFDFAVARLFPDGSPDTSYGPSGSGRLRVPFDVYTDGVDICFSGVLLSDGKLLLAGLAALTPTYSVFGFARLMPGGGLDPAFGEGGKIHYGATGIGSLSIAMHPRLQNGRVVAAVGSYVAGNSPNANVGVTRLETDLIFTDGFE